MLLEEEFELPGIDGWELFVPLNQLLGDKGFSISLVSISSLKATEHCLDAPSEDLERVSRRQDVSGDRDVEELERMVLRNCLEDGLPSDLFRLLQQHAVEVNSRLLILLEQVVRLLHASHSLSMWVLQGPLCLGILTGGQNVRLLAQVHQDQHEHNTEAQMMSAGPLQ